MIIAEDDASDRILSGANGDDIQGDNEDITVEFRLDNAVFDLTGIWTDAQIDTVGRVFDNIFDRTQAQQLLADTNGGNSIRYIKGDDIEPGSENVAGQLTVRLENWADSDSTARQEAIDSIIRQIGLNWSDPAVINDSFAGSGSFVSIFDDVSDWTEGTDVPDGYLASLDGEWFHLEDAEFFTETGRTNPANDWADMWVFTFNDVPSDLNDIARLAPKSAVLDAFFDSLS